MCFEKRGSFINKHPVLWLWVGFVGEFFYTLIAPSQGFAGAAIKGNLFVKSYLVWLPLQVVGLLTAGAYFVAAGFRKKGLRLEPRYPRQAYIPFRGVFRPYLRQALIGAAIGPAFMCSTLLLKEEDKPLGIATMFALCPGLWLAIIEVRHRKWRPAAVASFQVAGIALALGLLRPHGMFLTVNTEMVNSLPVIALAVASFCLAWMMSQPKAIKREEQKVFRQLVGRDDLTAPEEHFVAAKLLITLLVLPLGLMAAIFIVAGGIAGYPRVGSEALFPWLMAALARIGASLLPLADANGDPRVNGAAAMAALVFVFVWDFAFQGIVPDPSQYVGLSMTILGAVALSFTEKKEEERR